MRECKIYNGTLGPCAEYEYCLTLDNETHEGILTPDTFANESTQMLILYLSRFTRRSETCAYKGPISEALRAEIDRRIREKG